MEHSTCVTAMLNTGTHVSSSRSAPCSESVPSLLTHPSLQPSFKLSPNKFNIFTPQLFLPYCEIWNKNISDFQEWNFCSCNQIYVYLSNKTKLLWKSMNTYLMTETHEDWKIPQISINRDLSVIPTSAPKDIWLISQSVHVRVTWGVCLEMQIARPKHRLVRLGFQEGNLYLMFETNFPGIPDASTSWKLVIWKSWSLENKQTTYYIDGLM